MSQSSLLVELAALVRAGAADDAWSRFVREGLASLDDPAVLTLKGRILKSRARAAAEDRRRAALYGEAAAAYLAAALGGGGAYALINAATLSLLAGDEAAARAHALAVLETDDDDGPYYRAATRAEALLLLRRFDEAWAALDAAVALAPKAWEDHAVTLRQFRLLLEALGEDDAGLARLAPPRALHFTGHMAVAPDGAGLAAEVGRLVAEERIAFGYGALAAGADIVIAEALADAGVELHVLLPLEPAAFRRLSVTPWGEAWGARFDLLKERADTLRVATPGATTIDATTIDLAAETAMGLTVLKAATLDGEAVQWAIVGGGESGASARAGALWTSGGRRRRVLTAPRLTTGLVARTDPAVRLAAFLGCAVDLPDSAEREEVLRTLARAVGSGPSPLTAPSWSGRTLLLVYETPIDAARTARTILAALGPGVRMAGSYGPTALAPNPFAQGMLATGGGAEAVASLLVTTPQGGIHLGVAFAAALSVATPADQPSPVTDLTGDELGPYALRV